VDSLKASDLIQAAGVLTTKIESGQQWDSPNAWPPLVLLTVEGLRRLAISDASDLAVGLS
jgi:alpha,alpha-trehalase